MIRLFILTSIFSLILGSSALAVTKCATLFSQALPSEKIQAYIDLTISDLAKLRVSLDTARVQGTGKIELTALSANYKSKEKELLTYLVQNQFMTASELKQKIKDQVIQVQAQNKIAEKELERENKRLKEQIHHLEIYKQGKQMLFNRIEPGSFYLYPDSRGTSNDISAKVVITKTYDMMATPTPQFLWKAIAELAEKEWPGQYKIMLDPSKFKGEAHPVENISPLEVDIWIKALNHLSQIGHPDLAKFISNFKKGDHFALPTNAQWEFVVRARGQIQDLYHFGNDPLALSQYAWTERNSFDTTHPVGEKEPLIFEGKSFFDLHGNVSEIMSDSYTTSLQKGGTDPFVKTNDKRPTRAVRGGSWDRGQELAQTSSLSSLPESFSVPYVGFRLIREVKP